MKIHSSRKPAPASPRKPRPAPSEPVDRFVHQAGDPTYAGVRSGIYAAGFPQFAR